MMDLTSSKELMHEKLHYTMVQTKDALSIAEINEEAGAEQVTKVGEVGNHKDPDLKSHKILSKQIRDIRTSMMYSRLSIMRSFRQLEE